MEKHPWIQFLHGQFWPGHKWENRIGDADPLKNNAKQHVTFARQNGKIQGEGWNTRANGYDMWK